MARGRKALKKAEREKVAKLKNWLTETAATNRKNPTWAEQNVINYLESNFIKYKFQKPVVCGDKGYIIDFYFKGGFALEVDGETHDSEEAQQNDIIRTRRLENKGYTIYRIRNEETTADVIDKTMKRVFSKMNTELNCDFDEDEEISCFSRPKVLTFFEEYFDYMDDMTPEQFYEFMGLIRNLRYKGIDTKPEEVEDKIVRMAWRAVRPVVAKSTSNAKVVIS